MPITTPFVALYLVFLACVFSFATHMFAQKSEFEEEAASCIQQALMYQNSGCDKAVRAKAKALEATARIFLPKE